MKSWSDFQILKHENVFIVAVDDQSVTEKSIVAEQSNTLDFTLSVLTGSSQEIYISQQGRLRSLRKDSSFRCSTHALVTELSLSTAILCRLRQVTISIMLFQRQYSRRVPFVEHSVHTSWTTLSASNGWTAVCMPTPSTHILTLATCSPLLQGEHNHAALL